jgi:hypothetical protein
MVSTLGSNATPKSRSTATAFAFNASTNVLSVANIAASNHYDFTGTYNINLGSGGTEGRGLVAGYSGGSYGGIGYNVRHTTTSGSYIAPGTDTSSYLLFNQGFTFYNAAAGSAGRSLSYTTLGLLTSSGNFGQPVGGSFHRVAYTSADNSYSGTFWWNGIAFGNNGDNYLVAGRTAVGGRFRFYTNNTSDITSNTTPGGTLAVTMDNAGDTIIEQNIQLKNRLRDGTNSAGTSGQLLSSTGTGTVWVNNTGTNAYHYLAINTDKNDVSDYGNLRLTAITGSDTYEANDTNPLVRDTRAPILADFFALTASISMSISSTGYLQVTTAV